MKHADLNFEPVEGMVRGRVTHGEGVIDLLLSGDKALEKSEQLRLAAKAVGFGQVLLPVKTRELTPLQIAARVRRAELLIKNGLEKAWSLQRIAQTVVNQTEAL